MQEDEGTSHLKNKIKKKKTLLKTLYFPHQNHNLNAIKMIESDIEAKSIQEINVDSCQIYLHTFLKKLAYELSQISL